MRTLKQIMEVHALEYKGFTVGIAIHCTKEWLEQKRQQRLEIGARETAAFLSELLEELKE